MHLYHFTDRVHWDQILAAGRLDPNCSPWPDPLKVVSLSRSPEVGALPSSHWGLTIRIAVDVSEDDVTHWEVWNREHGSPGLMNPRLGGDPFEWWVSAVPIEHSRWLAVEQLSWSRVWPDKTEG
jgi:hypothetical protein